MLNPATMPAPVWVTVTVFPATVTAPVRSAPESAATLMTALPLPVPLAPDVSVMNEADVLAVQAQPLCVVTVTVDAPPIAAGLIDVGDTVYVQATVVVEVPVPAAGVDEVVLGAAGTGSVEQPAAATSANARSPSGKRSLKDEFTPHNIAALGNLVKSKRALLRPASAIAAGWTMCSGRSKGEGGNASCRS
jgi:hypothetical protein